MRVFTIFKGERYVFDVTNDQTVGEMKTILRRKFDLDAVPSDEGGMLMSLNYAGSSLDDSWVFSDISIPPGATLRCELQEHIKSYLEVFCVYSGNTKRFTEPFDVWETKVADLKTMITTATGLHVSVFRLVTVDGKEMYDCHQLKDYGVTIGDTVRLETWNGWGQFLQAATAGQLTPTLKHMVHFNEDPLVAKYQLRVALFIAAHFGYHQLAAQLLKSGARSDEPVGEHPVREWCNDDVHPDYFKTPVHEAAQHGNLLCLRQFLHHNFACILVKDKNGLTPCNLARRYKQAECFKLLIAEQFRSRSMGGLTLGIYSRVRKWHERAKDRASIFHKHSPNPILLAMVKRTYRNAVVGQKVQINGFGENQQTGGAKMNSSPALAAKSVKFKVPTGDSSHGNRIVKSTRDFTERASSVEMLNEHGEIGDEINAIENTFITEESVKNGNSQGSGEEKPEDVGSVNYVFPAVRDSRFHREVPLIENWNINKTQMQIKSNQKRANKARQPRGAYRWKDLSSTEAAKIIQAEQENHNSLDQREGMPQISNHNCLVCSDLQQISSGNVSRGSQLDNNVKDENDVLFVTQSVLPNGGEKTRANNEPSELRIAKIPPLRRSSLVAVHTEPRIFKEDASRKSDEDTKSGRVRRTQSADRCSTRRLSDHKRATSEDLSLQSASLYRMITGRDTKEWARSSLDVAMTFNKKRWLQQVQMAMDFNRNTFKRELLKFGGERQGQRS